MRGLDYRTFVCVFQVAVQLHKSRRRNGVYSLRLAGKDTFAETAAIFGRDAFAETTAIFDRPLTDVTDAPALPAAGYVVKSDETAAHIRR